MKIKYFVKTMVMLNVLLLGVGTISFSQSRGAPKASNPTGMIIVSATFDETLDLTDDTPTPTPKPVEFECVLPGDYYVESATDLALVDLEDLHVSEAILANGTAVPLHVIDGDSDSLLEISIPSSPADATQAAAIHFATEACDGKFPKNVNLTLNHNDAASLFAYDSSGLLVSSATATSATSIQTLELDSSTDIQMIEIIGSEILLHEICYACPEEKPTPTATPEIPTPAGNVIVTDDQDSMIDLSGDKDVDAPNDKALAIKWNINDPGIKDFHVYVLVDSLAKPKYLGRTGNGENQQLVWRIGNEKIAGHYRRTGPESGHYYKFFVFALHEDAPVSGPFTHSDSVFYFVGDEDPEITPTPEQPQNKILVTDDLDTIEDLSNGEDVDAIDDRELVIRWNLDIPNAKFVHIYAQVNNVGKPKFMAHTNINYGFYEWKEGIRGLAGNFKLGPQDSNSYKFFIYVIRKGGPPAGPFTPDGPILFTVGKEIEPTATPTLTPTPEPEIGECITASDSFIEPATGLHETTLGSLIVAEAKLADGTSVPFDIEDCDGDGMLDIWIPWSDVDASQKATIRFATDACQFGFAPEQVKVTLSHQNSATLYALDDSNALVASEVAASVTETQTLTLSSESGIRTIEIEGSEICIKQVCWLCEAPENPTPTPVKIPSATETPTATPKPGPDSHVIVTDDMDSMVDISGGVDIDKPDHVSLVIRWDIPVDNARDFHVYVQENDDRKPKFLGRTGDGITNVLNWAEGSDNVVGKYKRGPEPLKEYTFFIYALVPFSRPSGPYTHDGPVMIKLGNPMDTPTPDPEETPEPGDTGIPEWSVIVTDTEDDFVDLSGGEDIDPKGELELVIKWNLGFDNVRAYHVYALEDNHGKPFFIGRTEEEMLVWKNQAKGLASLFKKEPKAGKSYRFFVYVKRHGAPTSGPFATSNSVLLLSESMEQTPTPTPTATPTPKETEPEPTPEIEVSVSDHEDTFMDISGGVDRDDEDDRELVVRWTTGNFDDIHSVDIFVGIDGSDPLKLVSILDDDITSFVWDDDHRFMGIFGNHEEKRKDKGNKGDDDDDDGDDDEGDGDFIDIPKELRDGPQFGHIYVFSIVINIKDHGIIPMGPFMASGPVTFLENEATP